MVQRPHLSISRPLYFTTAIVADIHGSSDPAFQSLRDILQEHIADGREIGAAICVNIDGKNVVDIWGGHADPAKNQPWNEDTLAAVWSCTKVVTALAAMILVDRGQLDLQAPVAKYWPEFAANGKEGIKGGPPWWTPGEQTGYHMLSQGHFVGELIRRITGKSLSQFIDDEIATPLDADFHLGVAESDWPRTVEMLPPPYYPNSSLDPKSIVRRTIMGALVKAEAANEPGFRKSEIGAVNGFSTARALARIGSIVSLGGTVDGKQYISPSTLDKMLREQLRGNDLVIHHYVRFGLGVGLPVPETLPYIPEGRVCFWSGWGGSMFIMDAGRKMTISYVMNKMGPYFLGNDNTGDYIGEIYKIVDALRQSSSQ